MRNTYYLCTKKYVWRKFPQLSKADMRNFNFVLYGIYVRFYTYFYNNRISDDYYNSAGDNSFAM